MGIHPPDHEETCFVSLAATSCHRFPSAALGEEYMLKSAWSGVLGLEHFWLLVIFILRQAGGHETGPSEILNALISPGVGVVPLPWTQVSCVCTGSHLPK